MSGGITFRGAIEANKKKIIVYLTEKGKRCTRDIHDYYGGEKEMPVVRKALKELKNEGKITTDDKVHFWQGKFYEIKRYNNVICAVCDNGKKPCIGTCD